MLSAEATFRADPLDHAPAPTAPTAAERRGLALALIGAAALHVVIPLALLAYYALWPVAAPIAPEIAVEVVVEEPPPKPDAPKEKPKPPPEPEDERPAYDAPRAATRENVNRNSPDDTTQAPAAQAEPQLNPGAPPKAQSQPAQAQRAEAASPLVDLKPTPEAGEPAAPQAAPSEADAAAAAEKTEPNGAAKPAPPPAAEAPIGAPLPTIDELPQYKFARAAREAPVAGGNAESRYFTIVYGMIRSHLREPSGPHAGLPSKEGAVVFALDESGNLLGRKLVNSSGSPSLDMAVMTAIAEAAPFPAPPNWRPKYLRLTYGGR